MIPELYALEQLAEVVAAHPEAWRPMVFTCGCFDLLHAGHVRYLRVAKALGRSLVVGLNTDASVRALKPQKLGNLTRPIVPELQRAEVVAGLKPVDAVVMFAEITATRVIQTLQPEIYAKGGHYSIETLPEAPVVLAYGGRIELVAIELPTSTTGIIHQIAAATGKTELIA
jgi:rfaE bifunctional protein nucleotidyltransferase chain/domain